MQFANIWNQFHQFKVQKIQLKQPRFCDGILNWFSTSVPH